MSSYFNYEKYVKNLISYLKIEDEREFLKLVNSVKLLWKMFAEEKVKKDYLSEKQFKNAYLSSFLLSNIQRFNAALKMSSLFIPTKSEIVIIDFGSGPISATVAFFKYLEEFPHVKQSNLKIFCYFIDRIPEMAKTGFELLKDSLGKNIEIIPHFEKSLNECNKPADFVFAANVLNEIDVKHHEKTIELISKASTSDAQVVIVEPGRKVQSRNLSALRDKLLSKFTVTAPCTHQQKCPILQTGDESWCWFKTFLEEPPSIRKLTKKCGLDHFELNFSFLSLVLTEPKAVQPSEKSRVISDALTPVYHMLLCKDGHIHREVMSQTVKRGDIVSGF